MGFDLEIVEGCRERPAIVFIHGLGMDKRIWVSPNKARIMAGHFPINILICRGKPISIQKASGEDSTNRKRSPLGHIVIGTPNCNLQTVFHDLKREGYTLIAWSQSRPAATIEIATSEMREILNLCHDYGRSGFILIGHSRGGLIGRRYLQIYRDNRVKALITISSPHRGTKMATFVKYISPFASFIKPLIPDSEKGTALHLLGRISDFLSSEAVKELLPDSGLIKSLDEDVMDGVEYLSIGGSSPSLLCFYRILEVKEGKMKRIKREKIISFPDALENLIPKIYLPEEIRTGEGDGLVSVKSSMMPLSEHYIFSLNHAEILFSRMVRERIINKITGLSG